MFVGKLVGAILFEPVIERIGCKKTLYVGACIQILGIVRTCLSFPYLHPATGYRKALWTDDTNSRAVCQRMDPIFDWPSPHLPGRRTRRHHRAHLRGRARPSTLAWFLCRKRPGLCARRCHLGFVDEPSVRYRDWPSWVDGPCRCADDSAYPATLNISVSLKLTGIIARYHAPPPCAILYRIPSMARVPWSKGMPDPHERMYELMLTRWPGRSSRCAQQDSTARRCRPRPDSLGGRCCRAGPVGVEAARRGPVGRPGQEESPWPNYREFTLAREVHATMQMLM